MKNKFLPCLCGSRKNCNAQYSLLKMIKNLNLSKAFDTINHSLLLAKLKANGFSNQALLQSYICNRFQRSVTNGSYSSGNEVTTGVPQGSTLGQLLFNNFLNVFFFCCLSGNVNYVTKLMTTGNQEKIRGELKTFWKWIS